MKKIKLNTNLLPIIKPYGMVTTISDDYYDNCDNKKHTKENEVLDENKILNFIKELGVEFIMKTYLPIFQKYGVKDICDFHLVVCDNDINNLNLDFNIVVEDDFEDNISKVIKEVYENTTFVKDYFAYYRVLEQNYLSLMPENLDNLLTYNRIQCYTMAMIILLVNDDVDLDSLDMQFTNQVLDCVDYEDFVTWY